MSPSLLLPFVALLAATEPPGPASRYVQGDVVNVRALPDDSAKIVVQLPINANVLVVDGDGAFSRVNLQSADGTTLTGYIHSSLLAPRRTTAAEAIKAARAARDRGDASGARSWSERAVAIEGDNRDALQLLAELNEAQGRKEGARWAESVLRGQQRVYLAVCHAADGSASSGSGGARLRAELIAVLDPQRGPLAPTPGTEAKLARELALRPWFELAPTGEGAWVIERPFTFAAAVPVGSPPASAESADAAALTIALGPCVLEGTLYATASLQPLVEGAFNWNTAGALTSRLSRRDETGQQLAVRTVTAHRYPGPTLTSLRITGALPLPAETRALMGAPSLALSFWGLFRDGAIEPLVVIGNTKGTYQSAAHAVSAKLLATGASVFIVPNSLFKPESAMAQHIATIVVDATGKTRQTSVQVGGSGD